MAPLSAQPGIGGTSSDARNEGDAELNSEHASAPGETGEQTQVGESSAARPAGAGPAAPAADAASAERSLAAGALDEGQAKSAQAAEPSVEAEKICPAGKTGRSQDVCGSVAVASFDGVSVDPLREASAALDDRDYATAQRLFAAIGRMDVAEVIKDALAALDRKDYAKAHGLFEALRQNGAADAQAKGSAPASAAPPKPATPARGPVASDSPNEAAQKPVSSPFGIIPSADAAYRRPLAQTEKAKSRRLKPLLAGTGLALLAIFGVSAISGSPLNWTFPTTKSEAIASLSSAAGVLKADLGAIRSRIVRGEERSATPDPSAALTQATVRLDRIEHDYGARLDQLSQRDQDSSSRLADIAARLDKLETQAALPATPASESADIAARLDKLEKRVALATAPSSEIAGLTSRLNKLEKKTAFAGASSANPLPPAAPRQSPVMARREPAASNETARSEDRGPLLRDYAVENVRDGVAVVDSRYGQQEVAPGDSIPGAGRVLRIERRGGDWFVLTSRGLIASGPGP